MNKVALPEITTPGELAERLGWSERRVRDKARELGACRILGNRMILLPQDVETLLEATKPCPSKSTNAARFGITEARLPGGDYEALRAQRTKTQPRASRPKPNGSTGKVILMDRKQS